MAHGGEVPPSTRRPPRRLSEIARLKADLVAAEDDLSAAHQRIKRLLHTLCWYADPANYGPDGTDLDEGERARRALARSDQEVS